MTDKWLEKDKTTISKWYTNSSQSDLESLMKTAKLLNIKVTELLGININNIKANKYGNTKI